MAKPPHRSGLYVKDRILKGPEIEQHEIKEGREMKEQIQAAIDKIIGDPKLQEQFKADPRKTLAGLGVDPAQVKFCKPGTADELSDDELDNVAGGVSVCGGKGLLMDIVHSKAGA